MYGKEWKGGVELRNKFRGTEAQLRTRSEIITEVYIRYIFVSCYNRISKIIIPTCVNNSEILVNGERDKKRMQFARGKH